MQSHPVICLMSSNIRYLLKIGYTTHLMKRIQKGPVRGISLKLQEEVSSKIQKPFLTRRYFVQNIFTFFVLFVLYRKERERWISSQRSPRSKSPTSRVTTNASRTSSEISVSNNLSTNTTSEDNKETEHEPRTTTFDLLLLTHEIEQAKVPSLIMLYNPL